MSIVRKHLARTERDHQRGQRRPSLKIGPTELSIQHGSFYYSTVVDGKIETVQIMADDSLEDNTPFQEAFSQYKSPLGYLNVPIEELDEFLEPLQGSEVNTEENQEEDDDSITEEISAESPSDNDSEQEEKGGQPAIPTSSSDDVLGKEVD